MKHRFAVAEYITLDDGSRRWEVIATFYHIADALQFVSINRLSGRMLKTTTN